MKKPKFRIVSLTMVAVILGGILLVPASFSQSVALTAQVPFDFYVNGRLMPAGTYQVKSMVPDHRAIYIGDTRGNSAMLLTISMQNRRPSTARLVFNRYGSTNFLSELDWPGLDNGHGLVKSSSERELIATTSQVRLAVAAK